MLVLLFVQNCSGMGTKVEEKAFIPGCFDMADSSVNSNGNVLRYYEESKPSLCINEKFTIISANGSVHYDKEMLKRTMLAHEATFQKQVYELHRLYKIQKDLMAQFQGEEFNGHPRYADKLLSRSYASQAPPGDVKGVWQTRIPMSGHDLKKPSIDFMNETSSQYSVNRSSLRPNNVRSIKKMFDLQLPADVYDNGDNDVEILDEKPLKRLPGTEVPVHGGNVNLNIGNSGSKHVEKSWTTEIQPTVHILNKPVEGSSNMYQKQHYLSRGLNSNLLALQGNSREKYADKVSGSCFFGSNEEVRHINSFGWRKEDPNTSIEWLRQKQNGSNSSVGHYLYSDSSSDHLIHAPPLFNDALNSPWQSNNTSYLTKGHHGISVGSTSNNPYHPLKIHGEPQFWKPPPSQNYLKDLNLNDMPADTTATWEQGSENSMVDISRLREKPINLKKPQVPLSCANDLSQTFVSSTLHSEDRTLTRIPSFPISAAAAAAAAEKDSRCSPTLECDINITPLIKHDADKELQPQSNADSSIKNLFDLNEALPIMDDPEMQCESEGDIAPHEPDDPSSDSLAITAAENLMAICNDGVQPGSPQLDTLHLFAELATLKENTMCECDNGSDDDFEALTLKLEEIKGYEYHSTPRTQEGDNNNGRRSAASLLVTGPRSTKARGRPPKKRNFQKDILPGLASLPEQEVSEDLCALGRSKPATLAKRRGRKVQQQRGTRRAKSVAVLVKEAEVSLSPVPPPLVPADLDTAEPRITRWGRTTRRCRRPRCPPANNASLHVA
ncbi:hypothetical protein EJB05_00851 [Eragrostis curvula]|uniref:Uncharacterized protein n=1 Tax=Eragrostis curvula TaxID=38414 RepID=A0A5J9WMT7_9POAL|nr:hypothetical protein EJB05_00851 [Eragrostis curvula]